MKTTSLVMGALGLALSALAFGAPPEPATRFGDTVALKAGTIYLVEGGQVITGGGTVLVRDGKIVAVGRDVVVPTGVRVVDYGSDASLAPGFVSADSNYNSASAAERTAAPGQLAIDGFDPYTKYQSALRAGVTSFYLAPARSRLITGQGAVVKAAGKADAEGVLSRVLSSSTGLAGSVGADARSTTGYWQPMLPATVDTGLGVEHQQLPATTMGASIALSEIFALAGGDDSLEAEYGPTAGAILAEMIASKRPWRMHADSPAEVRAVLAAFAGKGLPLVIEGAADAGSVAGEIAAAGALVIYMPPGASTRDFGKGNGVRLPDPAAASQLVAAGVNVAVAPGPEGLSNLQFSLARAMRGGMSDEAALAAVTLNAARALGVDGRVGSLVAGKDADLVVLSGHPAAGGTVLATWVSGELAWQPSAEAGFATIISVEQLHLGDGHILSPGEVLLAGGRVLEVGTRVSRPVGATVVRGEAAMPGAIDALGYLGLEGSTRSFSMRFDLARMAEPGDHADRLVAKSGVTTVNMGARSLRGDSPTMAYRPAAPKMDNMVLNASASLRMVWSSSIPSQVGAGVKSSLAKAVDYAKKWDEYEAAMAKWTPPAPEEAEDDEDKEAEDEDAEEEEEDKKKKKKRKKGELPPAVAVIGTWQGKWMPSGSLEAESEKDAEPISGEKARLRLLEAEDGSLEGTLRTSDMSELVMLTGTRDEYTVSLEGETASGMVSLNLMLSFDEKDESILFLKGQREARGEVHDLSFTRDSLDYPTATRPDSVRPPKAEKAPKGTPKNPGINPDLEPLRQALKGKSSVIVQVGSSKEVLDAVAFFEGYGIKPVLYGASGAPSVASSIAGRVSGVLLTGSTSSTGKGLAPRNRYAELQAHGIPVAFFSMAEEGAAGLLDVAAFAVANGMSPAGAVRALTGDAAAMLSLGGQVGSLRPGAFADVVLLDGAPLSASSSVLRVWVGGEEVK